MSDSTWRGAVIGVLLSIAVALWSVVLHQNDRPAKPVCTVINVNPQGQVTGTRSC